MSHFYYYPFAWAVIAATVLGLGGALVGCTVLVGKYRKRGMLDWSRGRRLLVPVGGTLCASIVLMMPAALNWLAHLSMVARIDHGLAYGVQEQKAAIVMSSFEHSIIVSVFATCGTLILLLPCAVLIGLVLTVPTSMTRAQEGEP